MKLSFKGQEMRSALLSDYDFSMGEPNTVELQIVYVEDHSTPSTYVMPDVISVEVLPGWRTPEGTHMAGLRFRLAPGWKTYWRAPGDAGIPPLFAWGGSQNVAGAVLHWPVPEVSYPNGMRTIGYADEVVIPVELTPSGPGAPLRLAGTVELGVCSDICMPMTLSFGADLPADGERDGAIVAALVDRPLTPGEAGVSSALCHAVPTDGGLN